MNEKTLELLRTALAGFGLNDVEVAVYSAALTMGPRQASKIAKIAGLNRAYTYDVLTSLSNKGLMQEVIKNNIKHFSCTPPEHLVNLLEQRQSEVERHKERLLTALPQLDKLRKQFLAQPMVRYFQGTDAIRCVFEDTLSFPKEAILGFFSRPEGNLGDYECGKGDWRKRFTLQRVDNEIWYFGICCGTIEMLRACTSNEELKVELRAARGIVMPFELLVYGSRVALLQVEEDPNGLVLDSPVVAAGLRDLHRSIWEHLGDEAEEPQKRRALI